MSAGSSRTSCSIEQRRAVAPHQVCTRPDAAHQRRRRVRAVTVQASAEAVLDHIGPGTDVIMPLANGEPVTLLDAIEANAERLDGVRVHQMHALHDRPYLHGAFGNRLRHVSYFLSHVTRPCFHDGTIDLVPNNFSEMRHILRERTRDPLVIAAATLPDRHGYFSLGVNADYVASFIGRARFFLESNARQPRTFGRNNLHLSQVLGWVEVDRPLVEVTPPPRTELDDRIAALVAERIPDRATIQTGIGSIPNAILAALADHRDLGVHTELISDGLMDLVDRGVVNGVAKQLNRTKTVGTFALGTRRLYDFLDENAAFEMWPVSYVNDPRLIAQENDFVSINSTISVDLLGQCASETVQGRYYSSSGGQADFARGAMYSKGGQGFVVLRSTAKDGEISKIVAQLAPGDAVTTLKNTVDKVVTEWGVAELRGRSLRERASALIAIAHPDHRDRLRFDADRIGYL
jgi:acyl-CoA hydrolase